MLEINSPKLESWEHWTSVKGRQPSCRNCHTATLYQSYMILFGGKEGEGRKRLVNDLHVLDLEQREWLPQVEATNPGPDPRMGHSALLVGAQLLVYGGWNGTRVLSDCYMLDLSVGVTNPMWSEVRTHGEAPKRQFHTANCINRKMLVFGGGDGKFWLNDLYSLDLETLEWRKCLTKGAPPAGRLQHTSIAVGKLLYVFGGEPDRQRQLNDLYILDTTTFEWNSPNVVNTDSPSPRVSTTSCTVGRTIYFFGGYDGNRWLNDVHSFSTSLNKWLPVSVSKEGRPDARCRHTAIFYKGKLITFGGNDCDRSFNDLHALALPEESAFMSIQPPELQQNLSAMLGESIFADVVFLVEGMPIPAHKCILACRSEHFRAMFLSGMMESSAKEIPLPDISGRIFNAVLTFIYTDNIEITGEIALELLIAANRFCLKRLKSLCERFLINELSLENIVDVLVLAKRHQADELLRQGIEFATSNLEAVRRLPDLHKLSKSIMLQLLTEGRVSLT